MVDRVQVTLVQSKRRKPGTKIRPSELRGYCNTLPSLDVDEEFWSIVSRTKNGPPPSKITQSNVALGSDYLLGFIYQVLSTRFPWIRLANDLGTGQPQSDGSKMANDYRGVIAP